MTVHFAVAKQCFDRALLVPVADRCQPHCGSISTFERSARGSYRARALAVIDFCSIMGWCGIRLWLPQIMKQLGLSPLRGRFRSVAPLCLRYHCDGPVGADVGSGQGPGDLSSHLALRRRGQACGQHERHLASGHHHKTARGGETATFWAVPGGFLTDVATAGGTGMIVSIFMIGQIKKIMQGFTIPLLAVASFLLFRSILMVVFGRLAPAD